MPLLDRFRAPVTTPVVASLAVEEPTAVAVAEPTSTPTVASNLLNDSRAARVAMDIVRSIPAVRRAEHVIAGTISTFALGVWDGETRVPATAGAGAWFAQPEARRSYEWTMTKTVDDILWRDRCVWRVADTYVLGGIKHVERIHPSRVDSVPDPHDPDLVQKWIIDGREAREDQLIVHDAAGLGGLSRFGLPLLELYGQLQAAAGRYAVAPHPAAILKNSGADLTPDEINTLLDSWEAARGRRSVGYLNDVMDYNVIEGYSARDLQLVEAREHGALEVARLFGLPAFALDASPSGSSMTYGNRVDNRLDLVEALRPWMGVMTGTLSMNHPRRPILPPTRKARFDVSAYTRDDAKTRMETWKAGIDSGVLDVDDAKAAEPLARS